MTQDNLSTLACALVEWYFIWYVYGESSSACCIRTAASVGIPRLDPYGHHWLVVHNQCEDLAKHINFFTPNTIARLPFLLDIFAHATLRLLVAMLLSFAG